MWFSLLYLLVRLVLRVPSPAGDRARELELIVLRHEVKVLKRQVGRAKLRRADKVFLTALSRVLPREPWSSFVVTPATLLRWHRELVKRKWTHKTRPVGRPPLDPKLAALIVRMATDNPRWGFMRIKGECQKLGLRVSATSVKKVLLRADRDRLEDLLAEARTWPGVYAVRAWVNEGSLSVGDDIIKVLVAGDIRDNVFAALQWLVSLIKSEVLSESELR